MRKAAPMTIISRENVISISWRARFPEDLSKILVNPFLPPIIARDSAPIVMNPPKDTPRTSNMEKSSIPFARPKTRIMVLMGQGTRPTERARGQGLADFDGIE